MAHTLGKVTSLCVALLPACSFAAVCHPAPHSNVGCEFYAVTLPNDFDLPAHPFGIRALNAAAAASSATLQVSGAGLATPQSVAVAPGTVSDVQLPWVSAISTSTATVLVTGGAYHLTSDLPLTLVQFDTDSPASVSDDATLLVPVQNAGRSFMISAWPEFEFSGIDEPAQVAIVATADGTSVQLAANNIQAGAGLTATGGTVQMNAGDVLLVSSALSSSGEISGTQVDSSAPVVVFSAHAGTFVPSGTGSGDHLEDSAPPVSELGSDFLLLRPSSPTGGSDAKQMIKITGTVDGTVLSIDPAVLGAPSGIDAGANATFEATVDVHISADHGIVVSQFMEGGQRFAGNNNSLGDPSQLTSIPSNRGALSMDFIAPSAFAAIFAQVVAPTGANVVIDGNAVSGWSAIGASGSSGANVSLCCTDAHHAASDQPFTLSVYSYPTTGSTSYWYAGGIGPSDDIFGDSFE